MELLRKASSYYQTLFKFLFVDVKLLWIFYIVYRLLRRVWWLDAGFGGLTPGLWHDAGGEGRFGSGLGMVGGLQLPRVAANILFSDPGSNPNKI